MQETGKGMAKVQGLFQLLRLSFLVASYQRENSISSQGRIKKANKEPNAVKLLL